MYSCFSPARSAWQSSASLHRAERAHAQFANHGDSWSALLDETEAHKRRSRPSATVRNIIATPQISRLAEERIGCAGARGSGVGTSPEQFIVSRTAARRGVAKISFVTSESSTQQAGGGQRVAPRFHRRRAGRPVHRRRAGRPAKTLLRLFESIDVSSAASRYAAFTSSVRESRAMDERHETQSADGSATQSLGERAAITSRSDDAKASPEQPSVGRRRTT